MLLGAGTTGLLQSSNKQKTQAFGNTEKQPGKFQKFQNCEKKIVGILILLFVTCFVKDFQ
jgi:hypothetical protein